MRLWCKADALRLGHPPGSAVAIPHHLPFSRQFAAGCQASHWRQTGRAAKLDPMKMHKLLLLAVACSWALGASAQWQWIDKDGRKVFSDRPPPQDIPEKSILQQPDEWRAVKAALPPAGGDAGPGAADTRQAGATAAAPKAAASATKDRELERKKAQAEAAEAAKAKAEQEKLAKARAENCARARQAKATFESGRPMSYTNAKGERGFMDEATRNAEVKRIDGIIASDCKG